MAKQIQTHLMFTGNAEEAMNFYVGLFPNSKIISASKYEEGENKGKIHIGRFTLSNNEYICIDSPVKHDFTFTPAMSMFVECESLEELESSFTALSQDGNVLMPPDNYGFSQKFCWLSDRFGVSWQLNLE